MSRIKVIGDNQNAIELWIVINQFLCILKLENFKNKVLCSRIIVFIHDLINFHQLFSSTIYWFY